MAGQRGKRAVRRKKSIATQVEPSLLDINYQVNKAIKSMLRAYQTEAPADRMEEIVAKAIDCFEDDVERLRPSLKDDVSPPSNLPMFRNGRKDPSMDLQAFDSALTGIDKVFEHRAGSVDQPPSKKPRGRPSKKDKDKTLTANITKSPHERVTNESLKRNKTRKARKETPTKSGYFSTPVPKTAYRGILPAIVEPSPRSAFNFASDLVAVTKSITPAIPSREVPGLEVDFSQHVVHSPIFTPSRPSRTTLRRSTVPRYAELGDSNPRMTRPQRFPQHYERGIQL